MDFSHPGSNRRLAAMALALLVNACLIVGCATSQRPPIESKHGRPPGEIPVARYGRYTLVEIVPTGAQQDLMQQVVDVTIPTSVAPTVGEALRYVLLRSGYQLCDDREDIRAFDSLPLPAAHTHLGPLSLGDALQVLAGRAWELQVNDVERKVCFAHRTHSEFLKERRP